MQKKPDGARQYTAGPTGPTSAALTTNPVLLPAGDGWTSVTFSVAPDDWTPLFGSLNEALATPSELRLFHNSAPEFFGPGGNAIPAVALTLGVDNIIAAQAPEPGTMGLLGIGALGALAARVTAHAISHSHKPSHLLHP